MNVFDKGDPTSVRAARKLAEEVFGEGWEAKGAEIYNEGPKNSNVWGIGQSVCSQFQVVCMLTIPKQLPYRYGMALAIPCYPAESCAVMVNAGRPHGTIPRTSIHMQFSTTIQVA